MKMNAEMLFLAAHAVDKQDTPEATRQVAKLKRLAVLHPCDVCQEPIGRGHDGVSAGICEICWEEAGWENEHQDGGHEPGERTDCCPMCRKDTAE
jgi:hypothetical protein